MSKLEKLAQEATLGLHDANLIEGERCGRKAEECLARTTLFTATPKVQDAIQWYRKAVGAFCQSMLWGEAGDCECMPGGGEGGYEGAPSRRDRRSPTALTSS